MEWAVTKSAHSALHKCHTIIIFNTLGWVNIFWSKNVSKFILSFYQVTLSSLLATGPMNQSRVHTVRRCFCSGWVNWKGTDTDQQSPSGDVHLCLYLEPEAGEFESRIKPPSILKAINFFSLYISIQKSTSVSVHLRLFVTPLKCTDRSQKGWAIGSVKFSVRTFILWNVFSPLPFSVFVEWNSSVEMWPLFQTPRHSAHRDRAYCPCLRRFGDQAWQLFAKNPPASLYLLLRLETITSNLPAIDV